MSESTASTVGRATFIWEVGPAGRGDHDDASLEILDLTRKAWEQDGGAPSMPSGVIGEIERLLSPLELEKKP
jgi:hypothetical protein